VPDGVRARVCPDLGTALDVMEAVSS
jgi:hypothetical protein